jgi:dCMP deaminase
MEKILIAYIPVLHDGYKKLLDSHKDVRVVYVWSKELIAESDYLSKEIRALDPELIKKSLDNWGLSADIKILDLVSLEKLKDFTGEVVLPDDDISHTFAEKYLGKAKVVFDKIFLRWDRRNSVRENKVANDQVITSDEFSKKMVAWAEAEANKSSDWWRHVGAVIVKNGKVILAGHNHHVPSEHIPYANGDPRNCFHKGEYLELSTAVHAEAGLIAEAARQGLALEGAEIYVTTFPCPPCAKLIAYSGIKKIYYKEGYGVLDGEGIMKDKGIEIYFVQ